MEMNSLRSFLYWLVRLLGDLQAVRRGPRAMGKRWLRKGAWRKTGKWINKLLK
jgi:hypothetical protein